MGRHGTELVIALGQLLNQSVVTAELSQVGSHKPNQQSIGAHADYLADRGGTLHAGKAGVDGRDGHADEHGHASVQVGQDDLDNGSDGLKLDGDIQDTKDNPHIGLHSSYGN